MKTRHATGVPCPHNKGFGIDVLDPNAIDCLACKHILRSNPEAKEAFDNLIQEEKDRIKDLLKPEILRTSKPPKKVKPEKETVIDYSSRKPPNCPCCQAKMKLRTNIMEGNKFWGCTRYPKCKCTKNI